MAATGAAAAAGARDATCLEPLVLFLFFFYLFITLIFMSLEITFFHFFSLFFTFFFLLISAYLGLIVYICLLSKKSKLRKKKFIQVVRNIIK